MTLRDHDQDTARRYLLGKLTDDEQATTEQRLLTEDTFFEELEITKDELVEEYVAKQLTQAEQGWFEQNFLASSEGKQSQRFARTLKRYVSNHPPPAQREMSWVERVGAFWGAQPSLLRSAAAIAVIVIVLGIFWLSRAPSPRSIATLTLAISSSTRSSGTESPKVKLNEDVKLTLLLPTPAIPGARYRVELKNQKGETQTSEVPGQDAQSVSVGIPASQLTRGQYALTLSTISANDKAQRIPGSYYFTVE